MLTLRSRCLISFPDYALCSFFMTFSPVPLSVSFLLVYVHFKSGGTLHTCCLLPFSVETSAQNSRASLLRPDIFKDSVEIRKHSWELGHIHLQPLWDLQKPTTFVLVLMYQNPSVQKKGEVENS